MRVEFEQVTKRFGRLAALDDVSFALESGSRTALIGPNGAGKSTLTRVLMGMLRCEGNVRFDGRSSQASRSEVAQQLVYVPQIAPRLGAPVKDLVREIARLRELRPDAIAEEASGFGLDLGAIGSRAFRQLSGGMKQKLLLAMALACDAQLLILDEPTASLDPKSRAHLFGRLRARVDSPTLLLCSHRLEEIQQLVDSVLVLQDGRVHFHGPARAFIDRRGWSTIEISLDHGAPSETVTWLEGRGFRSGSGGMWNLGLGLDQKMPLLRGLMDAIGDSVQDISVRDHEVLDIVREDIAREVTA